MGVENDRISLEQCTALSAVFNKDLPEHNHVHRTDNVLPKGRTRCLNIRWTTIGSRASTVSSVPMCCLTALTEGTVTSEHRDKEAVLCPKLSVV